MLPFNFVFTSIRDISQVQRHLVSFVMIADFVMKFRQVIYDTTSGRLIDTPRAIAKYYFFTFGFWIDLVAAIPFLTLVDFNEGSLIEFFSLLLALKFLGQRNTLRVMNRT